MTSVSLTVVTTRFFDKFKYTDIAYQDAALRHYIPVVALSILEAVFFFSSVLALLLCLRDYVVRYTGKAPASEQFSPTRLHKELNGGVLRLGIFTALYAIFRPVCALLMTVTDRHVITESEANQFYSEGEAIYATTFSWLWIAILAAGIALAACAASLFRQIKTEAGLCEPDEE